MLRSLLKLPSRRVSSGAVKYTKTHRLLAKKLDSFQKAQTVDIRLDSNQGVLHISLKTEAEQDQTDPEQRIRIHAIRLTEANFEYIFRSVSKFMLQRKKALLWNLDTAIQAMALQVFGKATGETLVIANHNHNFEHLREISNDLEIRIWRSESCLSDEEHDGDESRNCFSVIKSVFSSSLPQ